MGRGRPIALLALDGAERETLEQWTRRPKTAQELALRARIVLACADGRSNTGVAAELRVCVDTVGKWRSRFLEQRLDGLLDQPRSGRPRMIDDADVERVIALTLEATPKDGKLLGLDVSVLATYVADLRPDGTLFGGGQGVVMATNGEGGSFAGSGVGKFNEKGGANFRGALYFYSQAPTLARLNGVAVVFEHGGDENDNTVTRLKEWK